MFIDVTELTIGFMTNKIIGCCNFKDAANMFFVKIMYLYPGDTASIMSVCSF